MDINTWLIFFSSYLLITLAPGPNVLLVLKNMLNAGYQAGLITILANLMCQGLIIILVALGAGALLTTVPLLFLLLKIMGGGYLIYLGLTSLLKKKPIPKQILNEESEVKLQVSFISLFREACLVSMSNPKTVLFLSAFLPQFLSQEVALVPQFVIMFISIATCVASIHLLYGYLALNVKRYMLQGAISQLSIEKLKRGLERVTGSLFVLLGGGILFSQK